MLEVTPTERELPIVRAFLDSDEYKSYLGDAQVCVQTVRTFGVHVKGVHYNVNFGCNVYKHDNMVNMCVSREPYLLKNDYDELGRRCSLRRKRMLGCVRSWRS